MTDRRRETGTEAKDSPRGSIVTQASVVGKKNLRQGCSTESTNPGDLQKRPARRNTSATKSYQEDRKLFQVADYISGFLFSFRVGLAALALAFAITNSRDDGVSNRLRNI